MDAGRNKLPRASDTLLVGNEGPVVIGFASLPYLPSELTGGGRQRLSAAVDRASAGVAATGPPSGPCATSPASPT